MTRRERESRKERIFEDKPMQNGVKGGGKEGVWEREIYVSSRNQFVTVQVEEKLQSYRFCASHCISHMKC